MPVTFVSKDPAMEIYIAHGDVPARTFPDPFEKVGVVPVTVKLSPGQYTIETASAKSSTGHERLQVESNAPLTVDVHGGDAMVKAFGGEAAPDAEMTAASTAPSARCWCSPGSCC